MRNITRDGLARVGELAYPARLALYGAVTLAAYQLLYVVLQRSGPAWVGAENGPIENAQVALVFGGAVGLFYAAWRCPVGRFGLTASACLVAYAAARESDAFLESILFEDAYKYVAGIPLLMVMAGAIWRDRGRLVAESLWLIRQPQATLFVMAGMLLTTFCQTLDRPATWQGLARGADAEAVRVLIEELSELFAYLLLAFSAAEGALMARRLADADPESVLAENAGPPVKVPELARRRAA